MDLSKLAYFQAVTGRMKWLTARQAVLAENVANADTPGYASKDLKQPNFSSLLRETTPAAGKLTDASRITATHKAHFTTKAGASIAGKTAVEVEDSGIEATPSGNSVVLEEEMLKVAKTTGEDAMMTNVYAKGVKMLRTGDRRQKIDG